MRGDRSGERPVVPTQTPPVHWPLPVHALPSSHAAVLFGCRHEPAPLQTSSVQPLVSAVHDVPDASYLQSLRQQSPPLRLPSSQSSPASCTPLPHVEGATAATHVAADSTGAMLARLHAENASA